MRYSRRFINFAAAFAMALLSLCLYACKGRTLDDVKPLGNTVEVVIGQQTETDTLEYSPEGESPGQL